jgi:hypothetical protein
MHVLDSPHDHAIAFGSRPPAIERVAAIGPKQAQRSVIDALETHAFTQLPPLGLVGRPRSASEQFRGYFPSFIDDAQHFLNDRNMEHRGQRGVTLVLPFFGPFARTVPKR